jgi:hypothetical protein
MTKKQSIITGVVFLLIGGIGTAAYLNGYPWTCDQAKNANQKAIEDVLEMSQRVVTD